MKEKEFWLLYEACFRRYENPGFSLVKRPLGGDGGCFQHGVYCDGRGWTIDSTIERSNTPSRRQYATEEACFLWLYKAAKSHVEYELKYGRLRE